jgi:hypothetical protein
MSSAKAAALIETGTLAIVSKDSRSASDAMAAEVCHKERGRAQAGEVPDSVGPL